MRISDWSSDVCSSDLLVETLADDRRGEFQEAALHRVLRQAGADAAGDGLELADRSLVATAVPADHDTDLLHHLLLKRLLCAFCPGLAKSGMPPAIVRIRSRSRCASRLAARVSSVASTCAS